MAKRHKRKESLMTDVKVLLLKPRLRVDEAAIVLDVTPRTVIRYLNDGKLDFQLTPGGRRRVLVESVKRYIG